jgi:hypothetical protein
MGKVTFEKYDPAEYIETREDVLAHLEAALEENDPAFCFPCCFLPFNQPRYEWFIKELNFLYRNIPYRRQRRIIHTNL